MIATSEIPLAGILANSLVTHSELPKKFCGYSQCYRREAGQGKDARGIYRLHQFSKVEMFAFTDETQSGKMLDEMVHIQTNLYKQFDLHFRVIELPTEELGASAYRKFDHEVWLPSKNAYCEVSLKCCIKRESIDYKRVKLHRLPECSSEFVLHRFD